MPTPPAREVIVAALAVRPPDTDRPDIEWRADLIVAALTEHGHLPDLSGPPTYTEIQDTAHWLAEQSRHPRYGGGTGWAKVLESETDVEVAYTAAVRFATSREVEALAAARKVLLDYHRNPPHAEAEA